ncbi:transcriptional regulator [Streptomyces sp. SP18CS02]|uniref:transcriptional regulator n=1 Tax=Streptomyces sp. SP18CS02 TaxID=3002531 RepID=UPI002E76DDD8|nr:transcriptional regulator [Streptomyces sp. SP18CS02]MEE1757478.1 transcriptional regulator [Streptomyces sp. SP18CS02]
MSHEQARELLESTAEALTSGQDPNRFVPSIAEGTAHRSAIGTLALEESRILPADRRAFLHLVARSAGRPRCGEFFTTLAEGETLAMERLGALLTGCGLDEVAVQAYEPLAGCQAYPAYVAWLALNSEPAEAVVALYANFGAWGAYCARIAEALRGRYGFSDEACGFFDFYALPAPALRDQAAAAVQEGLDEGRVTAAALRYGRLLHGSELTFWNSLHTASARR